MTMLDHEDSINHRDECLGPDLYVFAGREGDTVERCRTCGRIRVLRNQTGDETTEQAKPRAAVIPPLDAGSLRQTLRHGGSWPTHRARARNAKNRRARRLREAA